MMEKIRFKYFQADDIDKHSFYRIPKQLFTLETLKKITKYARGWMNYYGVASMKNRIDEVNGWLYHRIRMCIW